MTWSRSVTLGRTQDLDLSDMNVLFRIPGKRWEALQRGPTRFPTAYDTEDIAAEEYQEDVHKFSDPSIMFGS